MFYVMLCNGAYGIDWLGEEKVNRWGCEREKENEVPFAPGVSFLLTDLSDLSHPSFPPLLLFLLPSPLFFLFLFFFCSFTLLFLTHLFLLTFTTPCPSSTSATVSRTLVSGMTSRNSFNVATSSISEWYVHTLTTTNSSFATTTTTITTVKSKNKWDFSFVFCSLG